MKHQTKEGDNFTMDKAFGKMGIYDIIGVWLTGVIVLMLSAILDKPLFGTELIAIAELDNMIILIAGGYLIGMVFQEVGNFVFRNLFNKNSKYLREILAPTKTKKSSLFHPVCLTDHELGELKKEVNAPENDPETIYNYCKYHVTISGHDISGADRNQALSAISRSLFLYFALVSILPFLMALFSVCKISDMECQSIIRFIRYELGAVFLAVLFFLRAGRFIKIRYIQYLRTFYYSVVVKAPSSKNN